MELAKHKRSLIAYKGHLTRTIQNGEQLLQSSTIDLVEVGKTIESLVEKWTKYETACEIVESMLIESDAKESDIDLMQREYYEQKVKYQHQVGQLRSKISVNTANNGSENKFKSIRLFQKDNNL